MKKFRVFVFTFVFIIFAVASFSACELTHVKMPSTDVENPETPNPDNLEPDNPDDPPVNSDGEIPPDNSVLKEITGIEFPSVTAEYDGKEHVAEIAGELPEGVTVSYFNNVGVDAYIYVAEATLSGEGYRTLTLKTMINIKRADFKGVIFESATFACEYNVVFEFAHAQRTYAESISYRNKFSRTHNEQRKRALQHWEYLFYRFFYALGFKSLVGDKIGYYFAVACRVENSASRFEFFSQFFCVGNISVVGYRKISFRVFHAYRLRVFGSVVARSGISDVPYCYFALQMSEVIVVENFAYQTEVFDKGNFSVAVDCDARRFLSAVLKRKKSEVDLICYVADIGLIVYSENTALFFDVIRHTVPAFYSDF